MSVLVKGMEMPTSCGYCPFKYRTMEGDECMFNVAYTTYQSRPKDCPLVPVPLHGRLGDMDALLTSFLETYTEYERKKSLVFYAAEVKQEIADMITDAPTIIPASEEDVKAEEDSEPWLCLSCRYYPPSSTDGKPCSQCNPSEVWHSCYDPAEEGE